MPNTDPQDVLNPRAQELVAWLEDSITNRWHGMFLDERAKLREVIEVLRERDALAKVIAGAANGSVRAEALGIPTSEVGYLALRDYARAALHQLHATEA